MHKLTRISPFRRKEIWRKYSEKMKETKWKKKEQFYTDMSDYYHVHSNTIRKIVQRARLWDFIVHKSTTRSNLGYQFSSYIKEESRLLKQIERERGIIRYEKTMAGEMVHIDIHKMKNIKWENPNKKKYWAGVIDDATRIVYVEVLSNKRAKTLADFMRRAYRWYKIKGITIKRVMTDNGLEFTTHNRDKTSIGNTKHSFERVLTQLWIVHKYTKIRCPQTNGKIERFWKVINDNFWYKYDFISHKDFKMRFMDWLTYYNMQRPHWGIEYMAPIQKFEKLLEQNLVCI
jgi:transposase InsO family protein